MRQMKGRVVRVQGKTVTCEVERFSVHPLYEKRVKRTKRYQVDDGVGVKVGDEVVFAEGRPVSKTKRWKIVRGNGEG